MKKNFISLLLVVISIFPTLLWHAKNEAIPYSWDGAHMSYDGYKSYLEIKDGIVAVIEANLYSQRHWRANLLPPLISGTLLLTGGGLLLSTKIIMVSFAILLAFYIFKLFNFYISRFYSTVGTCLIMNLPMVFSQSLHFMNEIPVCATIIACFYYIAKINKSQQVATSDIYKFWLFFTLSCLIRLPESFSILLCVVTWVFLKNENYKVSAFIKNYGYFYAYLITFLASLLLIWIRTQSSPTPLFPIEATVLLPISYLLIRKSINNNIWAKCSVLSMIFISVFYVWGGKQLTNWIYECTLGASASIMNLRETFLDTAYNMLSYPGLYIYILALLSLLTTYRQPATPDKQSTLLKLALLSTLFPIVGLISKNGEMRYYMAVLISYYIYIIVNLTQAKPQRYTKNILSFIFIIIPTIFLYKSHIEYTLYKDPKYIPIAYAFGNTITYHSPIKNPYDSLSSQMIQSKIKGNVLVFSGLNSMVTSNGIFTILPHLYNMKNVRFFYAATLNEEQQMKLKFNYTLIDESYLPISNNLNSIENTLYNELFHICETTHCSNRGEQFELYEISSEDQIHKLRLYPLDQQQN